MNQTGQHYLFPEGTLVRGEIVQKKSQYTGVIKLLEDDSLVTAHWPATSRIENVALPGGHCLLSPVDESSTRSTRWTVEAIGFGTEPHWIGINQNRSNRIIEHYLRTGQLDNVIPIPDVVQPEVTFGNARFDFQIGSKTFIEVKTPLHFLSLPSSVDAEIPRKALRSQRTSGSWGSRIIKHFQELTVAMREGYRIIVLVHFLYDAIPFVFGELSDTITEKAEREAICKVIEAEREAREAGLEIFQVTSHFQPEGISLLQCFPANYAENPPRVEL